MGERFKGSKGNFRQSRLTIVTIPHRMSCPIDMESIVQALLYVDYQLFCKDLWNLTQKSISQRFIIILRDIDSQGTYVTTVGFGSGIVMYSQRRFDGYFLTVFLSRQITRTSGELTRRQGTTVDVVVIIIRAITPADYTPGCASPLCWVFCTLKETR